jgi:predicted amidophosphoribosyltransferase
MPTAAIAICSNPDCSRHAAALLSSELPQHCPTCGAAMLDRCWKCEQPLADPFSSYCAGCGVPLKRILPRVEPRAPLLAICSNPECSGAVTTAMTATLPSRCPQCHSPLISHCWKCGAGVVEAEQHYCQVCGVPLKRLRSVV